MDNLTHVFQEAGLGTAPFKVVGFEVSKFQACQGAPIQPGTSCDYCGTAIMNVYWVSGIDNSRFKVGCDCVEKTGDRGMIDKVRRMENDRKRKDRHVREAARIDRLYGLLSMGAIRDDLASRPHPMSFRADEGGKELDWVDWMVRNSGNAGKIKVARIVEKVAKGLGIDHKVVMPVSRLEYFASINEGDHGY